MGDLRDGAPSAHHSRPSSVSPLVQVFIPVYNDLAFLPAAIASALEQCGVDLEVLVSDNASTDGTSAYLDALAARDPRVKVYRNASNIGSLANLDRFRELVTAPYYMLLCSDDLLGDPGALRAALDIFESTPDVVSVYCDLLYVDGKGRKLAERRFGRSGIFSAERTFRRSILEVRNLFGIPLLHRTEVAKRYKYHPDLNYVGDAVHSYECAQEGRIAHIPRLLIHNRYTGRNLTASLARESLKQFDIVTRRFGLSFTPLERLEQRIRAQQTTLAKHAFIKYAAWRTRRG